MVDCNGDGRFSNKNNTKSTEHDQKRLPDDGTERLTGDDSFVDWDNERFVDGNDGRLSNKSNTS